MDQQQKAQDKEQPRSVTEENIESVSQNNANSESVPSGHDHNGEKNVPVKQFPSNARKSERNSTKKRGLSELKSDRSHRKGCHDDSQSDQEERPRGKRLKVESQYDKEEDVVGSSTNEKLIVSESNQDDENNQQQEAIDSSSVQNNNNNPEELSEKDSEMMKLDGKEYRNLYKN